MLLSMSSYEKPQRECQFIKLTTCTVKLFSDMPTNTKSNKRFRLYISEGKKITKISSTALKQVTQRDCGTSIPACSEDPAGHRHGWPGQCWQRSCLSKVTHSLPSSWHLCHIYYIDTVVQKSIWKMSVSPVFRPWRLSLPESMTQLIFYKGGFIWGTKLEFVADIFLQSLPLPLTLYPVAGIYTF